MKSVIKKFGIMWCLLVAANFYQKPLFAQTWYRQSGGTVTHSYKLYSSTANDTSGVFITNTGTYLLSNSKVVTSGNTTNIDSSGRSGQNAGILINKSSSTVLTYDTVITSGYGANGIFSTGAGTVLSISNSTINTNGAHARGVVATYAGTVNLTSTHIVTNKDTSSAIATDCAGGTINLLGGTVTTSGNLSAGIYSTGNITVSSSTITSFNDHAAVTDVDGKLSVSNSILNGGQSGLMVHKTAGGVYTSTVNFAGTTINAAGGHIVYDTAANLTVTFGGGNTIHTSSGNLIYAVSGATVNATIKSELFTGNVYADATSVVTASLQNSTYLNGTVSNAAIKLDATSTWSLNNHAHITTLSDPGVDVSTFTVSNIIGNGYNVYYNPGLSGNSWLNGKTYSLVSGGCLLPEGAACSTTGVNDLKDLAEFQLYPNPAADMITFVSPLTRDGNYQIIQPDGRIILTGSIQKGPNNIAVSNLSSGIYFFVTTPANEHKTMLFIKK